MLPWTTATRIVSPDDASEPSRDAPAAPHRAARRRRPAPRRHSAGPSRVARSINDDERRRRRRQREQEREAVDAGHARELSDRQHGHLAVAEQRPGKAVPDVLPAKLGCHPDRRRAQDRGTHTERPPKPSDGHGERGGKERQIRDEQRRDEERNRRWQPAERRHRLDEPVEGPGEVAGAGEQTEEERARATFALRRLRTYQRQ